jgi:cell division protein FtsW
MTLPFADPEAQPTDLEKRAGYDVWLLLLTLVLCTAGAIFVLTASAVHSWRLYHGDSMAIFWNHVGRLGWGLGCMALLSFLDYRHLGRAARVILVAALVLLVAVLFWPQPPGATAHRWIYLRGFSFQPAELAKFALINYIAFRFGSLYHDPFPGQRQKVLWGCLVVTTVCFSLILIEPNLSMALLTLGTACLLFFLAGVRLRPLMLVGGAMAVPLGLVAWLTPYMRERLSAFFVSIVDPFRAGYHVKQSLIGIGQGGLTGVGLGGSTQKHFFLPEPYKDFIFSIVGEELGLIGAGLVLLAFLLLAARAWRIARQAPDSYGYYLACGVTCVVALSMIVNVGVTLGVLPATGQPLPFVSYGGSSIMMTLGAVGVLLNISKQTQGRSSRFESPPLWV